MSADKTSKQPVADCWDNLLPVALRGLLRDEPSLVLTPLLPDKDGRQRFLVSRIADEILEHDEQQTEMKGTM
jgi:hypothetical protein